MLPISIDLIYIDSTSNIINTLPAGPESSTQLIATHDNGHGYGEISTSLHPHNVFA
jgi:hypothetical protein